MLKAVASQALRIGFACVVGAAAALLTPAVQASSIVLADLPAQGRTTYARIHEGGPFAYEKDGSIFGNRERQLPPHPRGYYREYTVKTPGVRDRGARRIVCGGPARTPEACYYTQDHYSSFQQIVP